MKGGSLIGNLDHAIGGGSLKSIKRAFSKKSLRKFGKSLAHGLGDAGQIVKKVIPKSVAQELAMAGAMAGAVAVGRPELAGAAKAASKHAVGTLYSTNLRKGNVGKNLARNWIGAPPAKSSTDVVTGNPFPLPLPANSDVPPLDTINSSGGGMKLVKGSAEAKRFMSNLRAMRAPKEKKVKSGGGVTDSKVHVRKRAKKSPTSVQAVMSIDQMSGNSIPRQAGNGFLPIG